MTIKQIYINFLTGLLVLFSSPVYVYAQTTATNTPDSIKYTQSNPLQGTNSAGVKISPTANRINNLQTKAAAEIQRRTTSLSELITKLNNMKHLSDTQKVTLTTKIQTEITNLNMLLAKIQSNSDAGSLKSDVQSIVTSHRIYALFMPQIRLLAGADLLLEVSEKMSSFSGKLQTRITSAQNSGHDTTSLQALLKDMNEKITDAKTQANTVITDITPLTPEGYPANKTILEQAKIKLQTGIQDLKTAGLSARQIIQGLVVANPGGENASSNSAVPKLIPGTKTFNTTIPLNKAGQTNATPTSSAQ